MKMDNKTALEGITPFTRIIYRKSTDKNKWQKKIRNASKIYNKTEWEMVSKDKRKAGTVHINRDNFYEITEKLARDNLIFYPCNISGKYSGFSHKHREVKEGEDYDMYGVITKNKEDALQFFNASRGNNKTNHSAIGELLKYPKCCQEAFNERWSSGIIDPIWEAAKECGEVKEKKNYKEISLDKVSIETNQMLRYFGIRITSHLPCSFECKETIELGKEWLQTMKDLESCECKTKDLMELLELPFEWDSNRGIVEVKTPYWTGTTTTGVNERRVIKVKGGYEG